MTITYHVNERIQPSEFIDVLKKSGLAERRPVDKPNIISKMVENSNLLITARNSENHLIGIARSITDFSYCCYLSCLAVDNSFQKHGIGKELIRRTMLEIGESASLILLAAPHTEEYYKNIGFLQSNNAYIIQRGESHQTILRKLNT